MTEILCWPKITIFPILYSEIDFEDLCDEDEETAAAAASN